MWFARWRPRTASVGLHQRAGKGPGTVVESPIFGVLLSAGTAAVGMTRRRERPSLANILPCNQTQEPVFMLGAQPLTNYAVCANPAGRSERVVFPRFFPLGPLRVSDGHSPNISR